MNQNDLTEHLTKEALKQTVDNSPTYSEKMKRELKAIIDAGKSPSEILQMTLTYFATMRFY